MSTTRFSDLDCLQRAIPQMIKASLFASAFLVLMLTASASCAQDVQTENVPNSLVAQVEEAQFASQYALDGSINPFYLRGDFDGDGKPDYVFRIKSKVRSESGMAGWISSLHRFVVIGAGVPFKVSGTTTTSLDFLNVWQVFERAPVERGVESGPPPHLRGDAILAGKSESASGLIYWNGRRFVWYQQGD